MIREYFIEKMCFYDDLNNGDFLSVATLENQLCFALYSASNKLTSIYRELLVPQGITYTQFIVLMALWKEDNISISSLAKKAGLSKATMTPLLKRLEQKNLIERQFLENNERQKNITLTHAGRNLSLQSKAITEQVFCQSGLSKQQAQTIMDLCKKIVDF